MKAARSRSKARAALTARGRARHRADDPELEPLTRAQVRELKRRIDDMDDPVRYLLVSAFTPTFKLYYNVTDDMFVMNEPEGGTLFKRRKAAVAVRRLLGSRIEILRCKSRRRDGVTVPVLPKRARRTASRWR
jgi:hypothetical protein